MAGRFGDGSSEPARQPVPSRRGRHHAHAHRLVRDVRRAGAPVCGFRGPRRRQAARPRRGTGRRCASCRAQLGRPVWVDDPHFNLAYHVRHTALPPPGGEEELNNLMGRLMSVELDRHRPLWETWMVEGLTGGRWAMISKVHHCMVDGISGTDLMVLLLDPTREHAAPPADSVDPGTGAQRRGRSSSTPCVDLLRTPASSSAPPVRCCVDRAPRPPQLRDAVQGTVALGRELVPAPALSIEGSIGPHRRWAAGRASLEELKADPPCLRRHGQRRGAGRDRGRLPRPAAVPRGPRRRRRAALARAGLGAGDRRSHGQQPGVGLDRRAPDRRRRPGRATRGDATADGRAEGLAPGRGRRGHDLAGRLHARRCSTPSGCGPARPRSGTSHSAA